MQPGWTSDGDQIHGTVGEECVEVLIGLSAMRMAESAHPLMIAAVDRCDLNARNRASSAGMRFRDVPPADQADVNGHVVFAVRAASVSALWHSRNRNAKRLCLQLSARSNRYDEI